MYVLASVNDQKLDYDPHKRLPVTTRKKREFDPSRLENWGKDRSEIAKYYGTDSERVLASILASGRYPEITIEQPISGTGEHLTPDQDAEYRRQLEAYLVGQSLSPNILLPQPPTDTEREAQPLRGWYTGGFEITAVTNPETVRATFQNIPQPQPTSQLTAA